MDDSGMDESGLAKLDSWFKFLQVPFDVPPYFHYCAAWALVHGAVALYHSPFWSNVLEDQEEVGARQRLLVAIDIGRVQQRVQVALIVEHHNAAPAPGQTHRET